ncbi:hypothetical protein EON83_06420 [bacterium]|nr:MAG: hypothetical protein EON83_06420 [bacterium]
MLPFDPKKPVLGLKLRFPHAKRRIQFFINAEEEHVYFRPSHAPSDWWGVLNEGLVFDAGEMKIGRSPRKLKQFIHNRKFFRQFVLPDPREGEKRMWSIYWHPEVGKIYPVYANDAVREAYFRPQNNWPCNLLRAPTHYIKNQFLSEWYDPTSDVREALQFCDFTYDERSRQVLRWETGNLEQLEHLIHAACRCEPTLWENCESGHLTIDPTENFSLYVHPIFYNRGQIQAMLSPRLHRVLQRICDFNRAFVRKGKNSRYFWNSKWDGPLPLDIFEASDIDIGVEPPTQHERMEASLVLRDWLEKNAPDLMKDWL